MPTLSQKQNGDYIIRSQIRGGIICTWQVDDKKAIFLLREQGYNTDLSDGSITDFPVDFLMELIKRRYVSTRGNHLPSIKGFRFSPIPLEGR
jgi:hypothetical protein